MTPVSLPEGRARDFIAGLRLLIVSDSSAIHTQRWAGWFVDRGAEVTVISGRPDPIEGARMIQFPPRRRWYHRIPKLRVLADCLPFRRLVRELDPQLIHFHFVSEGGRAFYWDGIDVPMVATTWGQDVIFDTGPRPRDQRSLRHILGKCRAVTAASMQLARITAGHMPPGRPVYVVFFGVDLARFRMRDAAPGQPLTLGFVKHLLPKYGPEVLVEAFARIHAARPNTRLVMAGRGWMHDSLKQRIEQLGLSGSVELLGRVPHDRVPELIRSFDLMVMPSVYESETFGVAATEASACGVPVVASRVGGVPEAVADGVTGLLVPPRDVDELAKACIRLIDDPGLRSRMGRDGRRFVEQHYQWQDNARRMEEVYRAALVGGEARSVPSYQSGIEMPAGGNLAAEVR